MRPQLRTEIRNRAGVPADTSLCGSLQCYSWRPSAQLQRTAHHRKSVLILSMKYMTHWRVRSITKVSFHRTHFSRLHARSCVLQSVRFIFGRALRISRAPLSLSQPPLKARCRRLRLLCTPAAKSRRDGACQATHNRPSCAATWIAAGHGAVRCVDRKDVSVCE